MFFVEFDTLDLEIFVISWIESVDPVDDLCLTSQIYSVLLNAFEFKEITEVQNAHLKVLLKDEETRTRGCKYPTPPWALAKIYPRQPYAPSFGKSRMLRPLKTHFLLFHQIFFILACIHAGKPRLPPRAKTLWGQKC